MERRFPDLTRTALATLNDLKNTKAFAKFANALLVTLKR